MSEITPLPPDETSSQKSDYVMSVNIQTNHGVFSVLAESLHGKFAVHRAIRGDTPTQIWFSAHYHVITHITSGMKMGMEHTLETAQKIAAAFDEKLIESDFQHPGLIKETYEEILDELGLLEVYRMHG